MNNNFFKYLKKSGVTQHKYALDNDLPESTISKWRKGIDAHMNEEHIYQAAKYFNISVNMLYYTEQELKELSVKDDVLYDPVMAQQHIKVKLLSKSFKNPKNVVLTSTVFAAVLAVIIFFVIRKNNEFWSLIALGIPFAAYYSFKEEFGIDKTYSINYLDDVYYKIDNENNQYYKIIDLIHTFLSLWSIVLIVILLPFKSMPDKELSVRVLLLICSLIYLIISIGTYILRQKKLKKEIYDDELGSYCAAVVNYYSSITLSTLLVSLMSVNFIKYWYYLLFIILLPVASYIEFMLVSKKYSEYKLVYYNQKEEQIRELFPNMEEK